MNQHEMTLETVYASGAEEWHCPLCERRILILKWHLGAKTLIVNAGTEQVNHSCQETEDIANLSLWERGLDGVDTDNL